MLSTTCKFCGMDRKYKNLAFTATLEAVCVSPVKCNTLHPNSLDNIRRRGNVEEFYTYEDAMQQAYERTEQTYKSSASNHSRRLRSINVDSLLTRAISFRVANEMQADYIAYLMGKLSMNKLSQVMQYLLNVCMEKDAPFIAEYTARNVQTTFKKPTPPAPRPTPAPSPSPTQTFTDTDVFEI